MPDNINWNRIDDTALALLSLTLHDHDRVWKQLDWDITDRLHEKGLITNPKTKAQSVCLTPEGMIHAERMFKQWFEDTS